MTYIEDVFLSIKMPPNYHARLKHEVAESEKLRQWMMYVDWGDGVLYVPEELVLKDIAANALKWAQGRLRLITDLFSLTSDIDHLTAAALNESEARLRRLVDLEDDGVPNPEL